MGRRQSHWATNKQTNKRGAETGSSKGARLRNAQNTNRGGRTFGATFFSLQVSGQVERGVGLMPRPPPSYLSARVLLVIAASGHESRRLTKICVSPRLLLGTINLALDKNIKETHIHAGKSVTILDKCFNKC